MKALTAYEVMLDRAGGMVLLAIGLATAAAALALMI
jgi:hypothetical protein